MNRRHLIAGLFAGLLLPTSGWAQGYADRIVQQLRKQGYGDILVSNTWLGRTRIVGQSEDGVREIIIDPRTGEILRDLFQGGGSGLRIMDDRGETGRDRGEDDSDDDSAAGEDEDEDNSSGDGGGDDSGSGGGGGSDGD